MILLTIFTAILLILFIKYLIEVQDAKSFTKQKAAEDREAKTQMDNVLGEYPTFSRYCTDEFFSETEISYSYEK